RAALIGLTFTSPTAHKLTLTADAHSELLGAYPTGTTQPSQANLPDTSAYADGSLVFHDTGSPGSGLPSHDWAAVVSGSQQPTAGRLGPGFRGPQEPAVICPDSGGGASARCDDTSLGRGAGGELKYALSLPAQQALTVWFTVAGSDSGTADAQAEARKALANPELLFSKKAVSRREAAVRTVVDLPGDPALERSVEWSKQNLADSTQEAHGLQLRTTGGGTSVGPTVASLGTARWLAGGFPDRPGVLAGDADFALFSAVAAGQFDVAKAHLRTEKAVSDAVNGHSGRVIHELASDGSVLAGATGDPGEIGDTARFPSNVALIWRWTGDDKFRDDLYDFSVRAMHFVVDKSDADGDGWPEGPGLVSAAGMGAERLDNAVYTLRGLLDLADLALSKSDSGTADWASNRAGQLEAAFDDTWWSDAAKQYADSLDTRDQPVFQRHWTGLTPLEAALVRSARTDRPLADIDRGATVLGVREKACYGGGAGGVFTTGTGATSAPGGNPGSSCDGATSSAPSDRGADAVPTSAMAVAEGNYGRLGTQQRRYTDALAKAQTDSSQWEMPGAMPGTLPTGSPLGPLFARPELLAASGTYGVLWPVVHQQLGITPDMARDSLRIVPQVPDGQPSVAGENIRVGNGSVDVTATHDGTLRTTTVSRAVKSALTFGAVLPQGAGLVSVRLDGRTVSYRADHTVRGIEVVVDLPVGTGKNTLQIRTS
ncbi:MAG: hypothetical protein QOI35_2293, partial [Cryptosporangiaceae bacterium]|nr:hypothetical protein [Cryptosporangiaceae bacterium]